MKTPAGIEEVEALFGNPANSDGTLNEAWEGQNIRRVAPPDGWLLYYKAGNGLVLVSSIRLHRLLEASFRAALDDIWEHAERAAGAAATTDEIRAWLHRRRLDQHSGSFNFRRIMGGRRLSLHSYGIAIDWDANHNPRKKPLTKTLPGWWYQIRHDRGWLDGCTFRTPDPMHVQFASGA
jgi:plasmid stabilization system protein ParE